MTIEILLLLGILLAKAQKALTPIAAANESQAKANEAAKEAQTAAQRGDTATAAQKAKEAQQHAAAAAAAAKAVKTPPPWPQVVPGDLPPYPSAAWKPANPVTTAMSTRAWQLLAELWAHGEGTWKAEKTADRWVVYKAAQTSPGKKGVVAFTTAQTASPGAARAPDGPTAMVPQKPPTPRPPQPSQIVPAAATQQASTTASPAAAAYPTLRLTSPFMSGPSVIWLQQRLKVSADGKFGPGTQAAVIAFQRSNALTPDGIVGPKTWTALGVGSGRAAA